MAMNGVHKRLSRRDQAFILLALAVVATLLYPPLGAIFWLAATALLWRENRGLAILAGLITVFVIFIAVGELALTTHGGGSGGPVPVPSPPHS
jgi:hypothetical protein